MKTIKLGIIGGGLMGREAASALGRWFVLQDFPAKFELTAVCDLNPDILEWYKQIPTVKMLTKDSAEMLASNDVDVVYVAVPHNLHLKLYTDVLYAGKDLLAEKPFGIDLEAAEAIQPRRVFPRLVHHRNKPRRHRGRPLDHSMPTPKYRFRPCSA